VSAVAFERFLSRVLSDKRITDLRQRAYLLATVKHEAAGEWKPVYERYDGDPVEYFSKYDGRQELGNTQAGDGYRYRGRGPVQLTGRANYRKLGERLGIDLEADPDRAMDEFIGYAIVSVGMAEGLFTGKKLSDYIASSALGLADYVNARRIVNGTDRAELIAGYARKYEALLNGIRAAA
jgi:putative chitinase